MSKKVLVIDDSLMLLRFASNILTTYRPGTEVVIAKRGVEGCYLAHSTNPDLILLDYVLPDMKGEEACRKLAQDNTTKATPLVVMCGTGVNVRELQSQHPNITKLVAKPFTPELLLATVNSIFEEGGKADKNGAKLPGPIPGPAMVPEGSDLKEAVVRASDNSQLYFCADTGYFSLRSALRMIQADEVTGVLRIFYQDPPIEVYFSKGRILMATTKNVDLYKEGAEHALPPMDRDKLDTVYRGQKDSGTPFFILLGLRHILMQEELEQLVHEYGQRLFAKLWTSRRVYYECEKLSSLPEFAQNYRPLDDDVDHWIVGTLRHVRQEDLPEHFANDPGGFPAYTREGYEAIQELTLTSMEKQFAQLVNGANSLKAIAGQLGLSTGSASLILYRFTTLDIMEFWPASVFAAETEVGASV